MKYIVYYLEANLLNLHYINLHANSCALLDLILILGVCLSARKEDIMKYIVYYLETNLHLLDKASEKVSFTL